MSEPKLMFRTIVKTVPQEILAKEEFRGYCFDTDYRASFLQPTVPMWGDLEIISPQDYAEKLKDEEWTILAKKGGTNGLRSHSSYLARKHVGRTKRSDKVQKQNKRDKLLKSFAFMDEQYDPNKSDDWSDEGGEIQQNDLISNTSDENIELLWAALEQMPPKKIDMSSYKARSHSANIELKRRYLLQLVGIPKFMYLFADVMEEIYYKQQISKIRAKAEYIVGTQYIASNDKRLYNKPLHWSIVETEGEGGVTKVFKGNQLYLPQVFVNMIKEFNKKNTNKLTEVFRKADEDYDYAADYFKERAWYDQLDNRGSKMAADYMELEESRKKLNHMVARQKSFWRKNTWEYDLGNGESIPPETFATEWDFLMYKIQDVSNGVADLDDVLANPEKFIGVNDFSPIWIYYSDQHDSPIPLQPVLELEEAGFIRTIKEELKVRDFEQFERE